MKEKIKQFLKSLLEQGIVLFLTLLTIRGLDLFFLGGVPFLNLSEVFNLASITLIDEFKVVLAYLCSIGVLLALIKLFSRSVYSTLFVLFSTLILFANLASIQYYHTANMLLDHVILFFSFEELKQIAASETGNLLGPYLIFYLVPTIVFVGLLLHKEKLQHLFSRLNVLSVLSALIFASALFLFFTHKDKLTYLGSQIAQSKPKLLIKSIYQHYKNENDLGDLNQEEFVEMVRNFRTFMGWEASSFQYNYPFVHQLEEDGEGLSPFFKAFDKKPNIVLLYCEGLSSTFSGPNARHGSMTPHLDSIYQKSLYWPNTLSNTDRTHGVFANTLASLPHGFERGVLNLRTTFPEHLSLPKILVSNGYEASFTYGGWAYFDNYEPFLRMNYVQNIQGKTFWEEEFNVNLEAEGERFSWGIHDKELFELYFKLNDEKKRESPFFDIILNLSLHSPYEIPNQEKYIQLAKKRFEAVNGDMKLYEEKKLELSVMAYQDQAIAKFLNEYRSKPYYSNTIFILVGDHNVNALPNKWKFERHQVPLAIFGPQLKESKSFSDIVAHTDLPVSIVNLVKPFVDQLPEHIHWLGHGLTTSNQAKSLGPLFLGRFNGDIVGVLNQDTLLMDDRLYLLDNNLQASEITDEKQNKYLSQRLKEYKLMNQFVLENNRLFLEDESLLFPNEKADFFFPEN